MIYLRRISGRSMLPTLDHGDYIVAVCRLFSSYQVDDIVIVQHAVFGEIVKRICTIDEHGHFWLSGDGVDTLTTEKMGFITPQQVRARMFWRIAP